MGSVLASEGSYTLTLENNRTERAAVDYLMSVDPGFLRPSLESRRRLLHLLGLPLTFARAFDLIRVPGHINSESEISVGNVGEVVFVELKTTRKFLPNNPSGFFFGATQNEFDLAERLGEQFTFCFVCLHPDCTGFSLVNARELEGLIRTKRTQYQINL
jgi:hypothetical protein